MQIHTRKTHARGQACRPTRSTRAHTGTVPGERRAGGQVRWAGWWQADRQSGGNEVALTRCAGSNGLAAQTQAHTRVYTQTHAGAPAGLEVDSHQHKHTHAHAHIIYIGVRAVAARWARCAPVRACNCLHLWVRVCACAYVCVRTCVRVCEDACRSPHDLCGLAGLLPQRAVPHRAIPER